jgi:hypothetical protein
MKPAGQNHSIGVPGRAPAVEIDGSDEWGVMPRINFLTFGVASYCDDDIYCETLIMLVKYA